MLIVGHNFSAGRRRLFVAT